MPELNTEDKGRVVHLPESVAQRALSALHYRAEMAGRTLGAPTPVDGIADLVRTAVNADVQSAYAIERELMDIQDVHPDDRLLPCPFCGSNPSMETGLQDDKPFEYVECASCEATAPPEIWNDRSFQVPKPGRGDNPRRLAGDQDEIIRAAREMDTLVSNLVPAVRAWRHRYKHLGADALAVRSAHIRHIFTCLGWSL